MVAIGEEEYRINKHVIMAFNPSSNNPQFLQQVNLRYFAYRINSLCVINPISKECI